MFLPSTWLVKVTESLSATSKHSFSLSHLLLCCCWYHESLHNPKHTPNLGLRNINWSSSGLYLIDVVPSTVICFHTSTSKHFPVALRLPFGFFFNTIQMRPCLFLEELLEILKSLHHGKRRKISYSKRCQLERWRYLFLDWINKLAKLKVLSRGISSYGLIAHSTGSAEIMKPPSCTILNTVGLLYQGQYHLSPGFNYRLCGWHTNLLVCTELNPWVQSCITKATIFSAPKIRRHMHGLKKDCFFLICELFIWRLSKIQKFNHI